MRFIALYCLADAVNIIYSSALKGAGDTRFVMWMIAALSFFCLIIPSYVAIERFGRGLYTAAIIATIYISIMALAFYLRYRAGKWVFMRVIEAEPESPADAADA
jgi:MATE family multidrug resistance protein